MADKKISALTAASTPLAGTEVLPIVQSGSTVKVSVANLTVGRAVATAGGSFTDNITQSTAAKGVNFTANTPSSTGTMTSQLLNWYEEGTWTPVLTFQTPGDLSVSYSAQIGTYTRIGNRVILQCFLQTSAFTFTTASGYLQITGIPFAGNSSTGRQNYGAGQFGGITKAGYTDFVASVENGLPNAVLVYCSGSAQTPDFVSAADTPTGGTMTIKFTLTYQV